NPSRSSFLTGFRPDSSRVIDGVTHFRAARPDAVTLPQHFHRQGYFTAGLSKVFHDAAGMDDTCEWDYAQAFSDTAISQQGAGGWLYRGDGSCCAWRASEGEDDDLRDGQAVTEAIRQIEAHPDQLFLAVGLHKPHDPFVAPKKYFDLYPPEIIDLPADPPDARAGLPPLALTVRFDFSAAEMRALRRAYAASVSFVDAQVGRLVAALERRSLLERTVIVLLGDNGHHLGEHGHWGKAALFEQATRVPLIIAAPGLPARGQTCARPVELIGLFATLCDLCGLPLPSGIQGASLSPLLDDPAQAWAPAYMQQTRGDLMGRSIRMDRYRYTEWDAGRAGCELYDHDLDAGEYRNLAADPSYASVRQALQQRLREGPLT
ncbi:MAG: sulfatase, partial [Vicinamibacteria bacterium]|nr:sulfatase [Vicinamibacteria bacterium]